ncbi:MAG: hypothetical protein H6737_20185 [Alphaproteobacteria bacterium]|nr:hypothetical protein [Alphaproteobacteria bacterium]
MEHAVPAVALAPAPAEEDAARALPDAATVGRAVLGFGLLGLCAALGSADIAGASRILPAALVVDLGALVLTGPALLVGHQYLGLDAPVPSLAGVLAHAFCRAGAVALGLCPALLFFAATSGLAPGLLVLSLAGIAFMGLSDAFTGLRAAEVAAGDPKSRVVRDAKMQLLVVGWMVLTALVGLRLGFHLAGM